MQSIIAQNYSILLGSDSYTELNNFIQKNNYSTVFILTDSNTHEYCIPVFLPELSIDNTIEIIELEPGEELKNIESCIQLWNILTELGGDRKSLLINVGGGVVSDLGGFVASTFKRGIDCINIPTTLLAMVDASIGGKNGVDLGNLKNQIGVISTPKMVVVDPQFLSTLPEAEMRSGFAEMLKHGLIYDANYWEKLKQIDDISQIDENMILRSIEIKNTIVSADLSENGIRKALNFGHTIGHAIESYFLSTEKKLLHGEAIAIGMIVESYFSQSKGLLTPSATREIKQVISTVFEQVPILENEIESIKKLLIHDKKNEYGKVQYALLNGIGGNSINQSIENELIIKGFEYYTS